MSEKREYRGALREGRRVVGMPRTERPMEVVSSSDAATPHGASVAKVARQTVGSARKRPPTATGRPPSGPLENTRRQAEEGREQRPEEGRGDPAARLRVFVRRLFRRQRITTRTGLRAVARRDSAAGKAHHRVEGRAARAALRGSSPERGAGCGPQRGHRTATRGPQRILWPSLWPPVPSADAETRVGKPRIPLRRTLRGDAARFRGNGEREGY